MMKGTGTSFQKSRALILSDYTKKKKNNNYIYIDNIIQETKE